MMIKDCVLKKLIKASSYSSKEVGGILGKRREVVEDFFLDNGLRCETPCMYIPDTKVLNGVIAEWKKTGLSFCGMFHTHFNDVETLSRDDRAYIKRIVDAMPETIDKLFFPIICLPMQKLIPYCAIRSRKTGRVVIIIREDVLAV